MKSIKRIVIHCSDSPNDRDIDAEEIHRWHLNRGFSGIGYHFIIKRNGEIESGRPLYWVGAHVKGKNTGSIGICLIGRDEFTEDQMQSLKTAVGILKCEYPCAEILGHYELDSGKTCPNFDVSLWRSKNFN